MRARRERSATESLLSITLVLESLLVFFLALVVFSLQILPPLEAFAGGGALLVTVVVLSRLMRHRVAVGLGWGVQALLIAAGLLVPIMYLIGVGFASLWTFCYVTGRRLDRRNAAIAAGDTPDQQPPTPPKETP